MRTLERNKTTIYYKPYSSKTKIEDANGNFTGEYQVNYGSITPVNCHVSPGTGQIWQEFFGMQERYDRVLILDYLPDGLDSAAIVWIDADISEAHDYRVKRIAPSINSFLIAVEKVSAGA